MRLRRSRRAWGAAFPKTWRAAALSLSLAATLAACASSSNAPPTRSTDDRVPALAASGVAPVLEGDGRELFIRSGCAGCHVAPGLREAVGAYGPDLTGVGSRPTIAGGIPNTPENLTRWLLDPAAMKPDTPMPQLNLTEQEAEALTRFLVTLR